jgi:hypothetical protein
MHNHQAASFIFALTLMGVAHAVEPPKAINLSATHSPAALWQERGDPKSLSLLDGSGGVRYRPVAPFTFSKEDGGGTSPK